MTGSIELDRDGRTLLIRFPYNPLVVDEVKSIPGRRWDPAIKAWKVPAAQVNLAVTIFMKHGFAMAPEITGLIAGTVTATVAAPAARSPAASRAAAAGAGSGPGPGPAPSETEPAGALTITALNERVKHCLQRSFPELFWVVGEIVDFDKNNGRKHLFFTLVEKRAHSDAIAARVQVALFESTASRLLQKLKSRSDLELRDGIEIRAQVRVDLYLDQGRYQLVLEDVDPTFTLGKMALSRERILAELRAQGLERRNLSLPFPIPPLRVGVLCSPDSDGWNDYLQEQQASGLGYEVTVHPVKVQGDFLRPTMLAGLAYFAQRAAAFDVVCVIRGGGSRTDLAGFDDREVAAAVARHPLKVLCGIGHQRDQSVLDMIAHSEKTPTAVAARLVTTVREAEAELAAQARRLAGATGCCLVAAGRTIAARAAALQRALHGRLATERQALLDAARRLQRGAEVQMRCELDLLAHGRTRLLRSSNQRLAREHMRIEAHATRQRLLDPARVLQRGFALVRDAAGTLVMDASALAPGQPVQLQLRDGRVAARTERIDLEPKD